MHSYSNNYEILRLGVKLRKNACAKKNNFFYHFFLSPVACDDFWMRTKVASTGWNLKYIKIAKETIYPFIQTDCELCEWRQRKEKLSKKWK